MRIGELAAAVGVSTRTVRHYHHVGVLPEPPRTASGYREYVLRDLIRLSRARRLIELGLGLDEVRDVLAGEQERDLGEVIEAVDADLAVQQEQVAARRRRLAEFRDRACERGLCLDDLPDPELVDFFARVGEAGGTGPAARLDREVLASIPDEVSRRWMAPLLPHLADEGFTRALAGMYDAFDQLAEAEPDDPRVTEFADRVVGLLPEESLQQLAELDFDEVGGDAVLEATMAELTPAQAAAADVLLQRIHPTRRPDGAGEPQEGN